MPGADEVVRSVRELHEKQQGMLDALPGSTGGGGLRGLADFFRSPDNLLALAVCLVAVIGIYRLLRSENIIPARQSSGVGGLLAAAMARRLLWRLLFFIVLAAIGLALFAGWLPGLFATVGRFF